MYYKTVEALRQLPPFHTIIGTCTTFDMDRKKRGAVVVMWIEPGHHERKAFFDRQTGEYIGEAT